MLVVVHVIVIIGMVLVVPLGLRLLDAPPWIRRWWPVAAAPAALALWLPRGTAAAGLCLGYAAVAGALAVTALPRLRRPDPYRIAEATALASPAVAALALVAERGGHRLFGFSLTVLALTVAHFHFAGFAAALVAGLVQRTTGAPAATVAALTVPAGIGTVLVGFFTGEYVELAGAALLTAGMWLVGWLSWRRVRPAGRLTRVLLAISATVLAGSMVLALSWALGEATGLPHPSLGWMVATHGLANALGFGVCAMFAWTRIRAELP